MADIADAMVAALAPLAAEAVPVIAALVPPGPAAELGRRGAPPGTTGQSPDEGLFGEGGEADQAESPVLGALRGLGPLLAERLLGALELTVPSLGVAGRVDLPADLAAPPSGMYAFAYIGPESHAVGAVTTLEQLRPGAAAFAAALARRLAGHPLVAPLLSVPEDVTGETPIAAAHGAAYLAIAVAAASAVLGGWRGPGPADSPAATVVGVGAGAAVLLLREAPMPARYAAALLARERAEYLLPLRASSSVEVSGHRFALAEGEVPEVTDFSGNGLVAVVPGGAVIRTGIAEGRVSVNLTVLAEPPEELEPGWDEIVEVSWRAAIGSASVTGAPGLDYGALRRATPPWPGDYRLRVHAYGRDDADDAGEDSSEEYELVVWQAPAAPEIVYRRTDRLGHRLRGEPEPDRPDRPERAYRWVEDSSLSVAATVTVVTGATAEEVLHAFGADPGRPESLRGLEEEAIELQSIDPWVAVLSTPTAVLAVEYNGFQGADDAVIGRASAGGRAASMFWNVNALTRLTFAERGRELGSFESPEETELAPEVAEVLSGLDFDDYRNTVGRGLVAVERFTGSGITPEDLDRLEAADIAFRITPE